MIAEVATQTGIMLVLLVLAFLCPVLGYSFCEVLRHIDKAKREILKAIEDLKK